MKYGYEEGEVCGRKDCKGVIAILPVENCRCHINPPCSACTTPAEYCSECDWQAKDDRIINDYRVNIDKSNDTFRCWEPRPLDPTKIDWRSKSHTHFSMVKEGVYPPETTRAEVEKKVAGTFGGRFEYFSGGHFKYIAYTD